jgi:hypothetical protein
MAREPGTDRRSIARHEAAHAVAAYEFGVPFTDAVVDDTSGRVSGLARFTRSMSPGETLRRVSDRFVIHLVGPVADERNGMTGEMLRQSRLKHMQIVFAARYPAIAALGEDIAAGIAEHAWKRADDLVVVRWDDIVALGAVLDARGRLEGGEIFAILRKRRRPNGSA